ncbi:hypothetical protein LV89_01979 [Arcicella aurantiaca]|uniref:Uncharacterized protein n=1 Tax=Arcicella aurantiaca TaxID=591202 RepID=A0A316EBU7_9BACT|nr:hypothetical protein [Arcicella aurantiaca]PWK27164.1 hypothetical protein LV89_01979 [Arcicella aurantiaca]
MDYTPEILAYLREWATSTEKIIGKAIDRQGVKISEPDEKNILIEVLQSGLNTLRITISARDALRFVDMGAGRGWRKGVPMNSISTGKARVKKPVWNKPLFKRIARLQEVVTSTLIEQAIQDFPNKL